MAEAPETPTREARLAAKLRENLRRRKAQSRAQGQSAAPAQPGPAEPGLPKAGPKS